MIGFKDTLVVRDFDDLERYDCGDYNTVIIVEDFGDFLDWRRRISTVDDNEFD